MAVLAALHTWRLLHAPAAKLYNSPPLELQVNMLLGVCPRERALLQRHLSSPLEGTK